MLKRIISFMLCALLVFQMPVTAYADTPGVSSGRDTVPTSGSPGYGKESKAQVWKAYGFRVTLTTAAPMVEEGIQKLENAYTNEDVTSQREQVENILTHRYWEPGDFGIYFYKKVSTGVPTPTRGVASSQPGEVPVVEGGMTPMEPGNKIEQDYNYLAWTCWQNPNESIGRPAGVPAFNEELYNILVGNGTQYANGDDWLYDIKQKYYAASGANDADVLARIQTVVSDGTYTADNIRNFSWDTTLNGGTPQEQVFFSFVGHLTMCIQFAWYAQIKGNTSTYNAMRDLLYSYYVSRYQADAMPVLQIEACSATTKTGRSTWDPDNTMLETLPYMLNFQYGTDSSPVLFSKWPDGINTTEGIVAHIAGDKPAAIPGLRLGRGLGYYYDGGLRKESDRESLYFETLKPTDKSPELVGYLVAFCYFADNPPGKPGGGPDPAKGTFTWDLTPKGIIDKTPSEEVNESSTIYNLNVSQNGHNSNNYAEWEKWVLSDGKGCNKIRFNIYHVSEALNKDVPATDYTYGQVKATGKKVTEAVDRVTVGSGQIGNVPSIGYEVVNILQI